MTHIFRLSGPLPTAFTAIAMSAALTACQPDEQPIAPEPQDVYFDRLSQLCGKAFSGTLASDQAVDADMAGKPMIMHVAHCDQNEIRIPFHVGPSPTDAADSEWDRSRTWIITRITDGDKSRLRLKHRHRHEDGSLDAVTNYGGDTVSRGSAERQQFPVDAESIALFKQEGLDQSVTNVWAVEISPPGQSDARFAYELRRPAPSGTPSDTPATDAPSDNSSPEGRFFRVEFDLTKAVPPPPPPWGDQD
ncbi:hypothetical protein AB1K62_00260 [Parasphingorhabdus sp. JC815]|uniref:hypothetical protein n=1 Tax=Parasphingorhabdus sp. JC815 TaxID=3232140 RepID=UPI0034581A0C